MHAAVPPSIIKIGGSVVAHPQLHQVLAARINLQQPALFLAGGGPAADWVRAVDQLTPLAADVSHWTALAAMRLSGRLLAARLGVPLFDNVAQLYEYWQITQGPACFDVWPLLARNPQALPCTWDVTSDTVAAWLTMQFVPTKRLVFVKHCGPAWHTRLSAADIRRAAGQGWLDHGLDWLPATTQVDWLNAADPANAGAWELASGGKVS